MKHFIFCCFKQPWATELLQWITK